MTTDSGEIQQQDVTKQPQQPKKTSNISRGLQNCGGFLLPLLGFVVWFLLMALMNLITFTLWQYVMMLIGPLLLLVTYVYPCAAVLRKVCGVRVERFFTGFMHGFFKLFLILNVFFGVLFILGMIGGGGAGYGGAELILGLLGVPLFLLQMIFACRELKKRKEKLDEELRAMNGAK